MMILAYFGDAARGMTNIFLTSLARFCSVSESFRSASLKKRVCFIVEAFLRLAICLWTYIKAKYALCRKEHDDCLSVSINMNFYVPHIYESTVDSLYYILLSRSQNDDVMRMEKNSYIYCRSIEALNPLDIA